MGSNWIRTLLSQIYGDEINASLSGRLEAILAKYRSQLPQPRAPGLTERDAILITYPDQVQEEDRPALQVLAEFCETHLTGIVSGIHVLPFYPWSSDDGFSVTDYRAVAPEYGDWADIRRIGEHFRLMFDAVINHASVGGTWFRGFLKGDPAYGKYFIEIEGEPDLSAVVRPRALPLLTHLKNSSGEKTVWTTFSADQADLNYCNPDVLLNVMDVLLFYVSQGAEFIRLDAIAYLWKEIGTACIHLPQTHAIVQLIRAVLDEVAPHVMLITETNVPHAENLSYFGNGNNEAQMVYNFSLPPLVLHAFQTGSTEALSRWAASLRLPAGRVTFFNSLASHDGIGLNPLRGILPEAEIEALVEQIKSRGGLVSYKNNPDGTRSPYELNVNYLDALSVSGESLAMQLDRFVSAHAILLAFLGIPAVYFHSLFGSRGWMEGVAQTGRNRSVNRQKLQKGKLERELANPTSLRSQIFNRLSHLLRLRAVHSAFSPQAAQYVFELDRRVFAIGRQNISTGQALLCLHNVSDETLSCRMVAPWFSPRETGRLYDVINEKPYALSAGDKLALRPYQAVWLVYQH